MLLANWSYWNDDWLLYHKVVFDGVARTITVTPGVTEINIRNDVYSSWKEWVLLRDNTQYMSAMRVTGGDPIGDGKFTGDVYFLINGWTFVVDITQTRVSGVLFSDDYDSAYRDVYTGKVIYPAEVSSIVNTVNTSGGTGGVTAAEVWNYYDRTLTNAPTYNGPTAVQIRQEMDTNSSKLTSIKAKTDTIAPPPTPTMIADQVRVELTPELNKINALDSNPGLTPSQATMLLEMYELLGLDPTKPLVVTNTTRTAGSIEQAINTNQYQTVVTRV